ncbi:MAG: hypothetical protein KatS3mg042_0712 [Rhodothermaceae bacterium]|nr:MAG: hypothetical protein KatS3mg042_0712 [Rhodothermaceae bacterium]
MQIEQTYHTAAGGWRDEGSRLASADLVLAFGHREGLADPRCFDELRARYPRARLVLGSTSGEILDAEVSDDRLTVTAVRFERTRVRAASVAVSGAAESYAAGRALARRLTGDDLVYVFVLSDGRRVNGSALAQGFNDHLPEGTLVTGGLAGDGMAFERTLVGLDAAPTEGQVVAVGFYGASLRVGFGSSGGWAPFGPVRRVTRAEDNVLFELDGQPALALYRRYLGDLAAGLPGAALRFPLCVWTGAGTQARTVVRTITGLDEDGQRMIFAGDVPAGARARFMRASYEDLVDGAAGAAGQGLAGLPGAAPDLAICVSCWGRRLVLGQRVEEEIEAVREVLGPRPALTGFYSYGELAPPEAARRCELHNQTMTITLLREEV